MRIEPDADDVLEESPPTSRSHELATSTSKSASARERLERLLDRIEGLLDELDAEDEDDEDAPRLSGSAKLAIYRALVSPIRLLGHFTGEVGASETTVAASPFYRRVRVAVVEALRAHPDAAKDVLLALERVEGITTTSDRDEAAA